ncbi:hypothetical protein J437_LFUL013880 [Ladona fulva]|uniref:Uncharacterized protein n=1 Tax=Ladona fulva TaxID=123851 RepID=A0A8K0KHI2_LADFU|nr:hypothetical protein J437_LFUL013880 [Ladona fulva]
MADEGIYSLGHVSSPTPTSSLYNELVEIKSLRKSVIFKKPAIVQNNAEDTYSMDISSAKTEQLPTVQGRGRSRLGSVKLNDDDKEGLELMKTLKPFSIDLGLRCDSKEFLSQLCGKHFVAAAINMKQDEKSRASLSHAENGKGSPKSLTGHLTFYGHESERRTKVNRLERSTSENLSIEEMPALIPEFSVMQEVCGLKISNYNVKKASQGPRVENDVDKEDRRKPIQVLSRLIDDNEVQIVLELVKPEKKVNLHQMQACINRLKGWREAESVEEEFVVESLSSYQPSSHSEPNHVIRRNEEVFERMTLEFPSKNARERLFSTHSVMTSGTEMLMFNKKKEQKDCLNKAEGLGGKLQFDESVPYTALSNIVVTNVRSGAELTEEERDIPLSLEYDELSEIRGQAYNELREIPAEGDTEMKTTHVGCKKDVLNVFFRKNANTLANAPCGNESCMSGGEVTGSLQENVIHLAGYNNLDTFLPDVVKVSHTNLSHGITMPKEKEPSLEKYLDIKGAFNEDSILPRLPEFGVGSQQYDQCNDESLQIEKFIPLITLSPQKVHRANVVQTTKLPKSQTSQNNLSKPAVYHSNKIGTIKQLIKGCKSHQSEGTYPSNVDLDLNHLTCNDSVDSILHRETIPSMMLSPQKMSRAVVIPAALCCQLEQAAYHSSSFRTPFRENNWDEIPQNLTSASQETSNDLYQGSLEVNLPVTATVPPNIPSKPKALTGFVPSDTQGLIVLSHDRCKFLKFQKLGHNTCTPSQEVSITGTVNPGTSGCSVDLVEHHQLTKLGEIMSNSEDILKKELNTLAKSLGMKLLMTQPGRNQLGKFILYNIEEKKPESNIIRVDYCKSSQMKQKS